MSLITTSRHPKTSSRILSKDLALIIPDSIRINRGKLNLKNLILKALSLNKNILIIIEGGTPTPRIIKILKIDSDGQIEHEYRIKLKGFIRKKEVSRKRAPESDKFYYKIKHSIPTELRNKILKLVKLFRLKKFPHKGDVEKNAIIFSFEYKEGIISLRFFTGEVIEIGPRIYIKSIGGVSNGGSNTV
ncbi:MAG: hypothetical protein ACTSYR_03680 [Candidatus Odinarchaeia archaeon]